MKYVLKAEISNLQHFRHLDLKLHGGHDHSRNLFFHPIQNIHYFRSHVSGQRYIARPMRLTLLPQQCRDCTLCIHLLCKQSHRSTDGNGLSNRQTAARDGISLTRRDVFRVSQDNECIRCHQGFQRNAAALWEVWGAVDCLR